MRWNYCIALTTSAIVLNATASAVAQCACECEGGVCDNQDLADISNCTSGDCTNCGAATSPGQVNACDLDCDGEVDLCDQAIALCQFVSTGGSNPACCGTVTCGACCNPGSLLCSEADVDGCTSLNGFYMGDGVSCEDAACAHPCPPSLAPEIEVLPVNGVPMEMNKVRYLAFSVPESGQRAVQVTFDNLPSPFDIVNGTAMWVTEPRGECETAGHAFDKFSIEDCGAAPGLPTNIYKVAELQCDPLYRDWSGDGVINVYGELIVPNGTYSISVVDATCPPFEPDSFSAPLTITTAIWGDVVKDCTAAFNLGSRCGPPDKSVDIVTDVLTVLQKFQNLLGISKSRADMEPGLLDGEVNISDVTFVVDAFSGDPYPFAVPELCPGGP